MEIKVTEVPMGNNRIMYILLNANREPIEKV